jgi:glutathione S-transferase
MIARGCLRSLSRGSKSILSRRTGLRTMATAQTLYDVPVSNNGARIRLLIYKKKLQDVVEIKSPAEIGGLTSDAYRALNPQAKMPVLQLEDGSGLPESQVIESYILDKYVERSPSLVPATPELRARASLIVRILDVYINSIQGCMYKPMESKSERASQIGQLAKQLDVLEGYVVGPYCTGEVMSYADTALVPTFVFMNFILPKFFGWPSLWEERPKLEAWWKLMNQDEEAKQVINEVEEGLKSWDKMNRWEDKGITRQVSDSSLAWYPQ